jgi:uncharacterized protein
MAAVGVLTLELHLIDARSLKDKRHYVLGLKERLRHRFNLAVAEIADQDLQNRGVLAAVTISPSRDAAERVLRAAEDHAAEFLGPFLTSAHIEWLD